MIREQWCWIDELCMKGFLSTLPSFSRCTARLLTAILMCAFVKPLCGPFCLFKLSNHIFRIHLLEAACANSLVHEDISEWFRQAVQSLSVVVFVCKSELPLVISLFYITNVYI